MCAFEDNQRGMAQKAGFDILQDIEDGLTLTEEAEELGILPEWETIVSDDG